MRGGGCLLLGGVYTKTGRPVLNVLQEKYPYMCVLLLEKHTCASFEEYEKVLETVPVDFSEDNVTWVASNLSSAAGSLGAEGIELKNWLLFFGCDSEEFRVVVANMANWMANYPPLLDAYHDLMAYLLVVLNNCLGVLPVWIG